MANLIKQCKYLATALLLFGIGDIFVVLLIKGDSLGLSVVSRGASKFAALVFSVIGFYALNAALNSDSPLENRLSRYFLFVMLALSAVGIVVNLGPKVADLFN